MPSYTNPLCPISDVTAIISSESIAIDIYKRFMWTVAATTQHRYDPISDLCIFHYSTIPSFFCTHHTVEIFCNRLQIIPFITIAFESLLSGPWSWHPSCTKKRIKTCSEIIGFLRTLEWRKKWFLGLSHFREIWY